MHHAVVRQLQHLGMIQDRLVEHQAVLERPPQQFGILNASRGVGEGDRAGLDQRADFGQLFARPILADAARHEHVAVARAGRLLPDELHAGLGVDRRLGIGQADDRGETAGHRRRRAAFDRFVLLAARFPQLDVQIDQARRDDLAGGRNHAFVAGRSRVVGGDAAVVDQQVRDAIELLAGINHSAVFDQDARHDGKSSS